MFGDEKPKPRFITLMTRNLIPRHSCYFMGYAERSNEFRFHCPNHNMKIVETRKALFLELQMDTDSSIRTNDFVFEEEGEMGNGEENEMDYH